MFDGRVVLAPARASVHGRRGPGRLRHRRRRRQGRESRRRSRPQSPARPEKPGTPRRHLRRRRRRGRAHLPDPAGLLQGGGQAAQARPGQLPQARRTACRRRLLLPRRRRRQARPGQGHRPRGAGAAARSTGLGWRPVPTNDDVLPPEPRAGQARRDRAAARCALQRPPADEVERWLYRRRLELRHRSARPGSTSTSRRSRPGWSATRGCSPAPSSSTSTPTWPTRRSRPASPSSTAATRPTPTRTGRWPSRSATRATTARSTRSAPTATPSTPTPAA